MILQVFILAAGFFLLVKGADWFVEGAAGIAKKMGIPQLVIGLTIVAMGTSMPEAAVSITAAFNHNAGITIGNIVGSNILNILIILGITAVITNVAIQKSTFRYEIPFMIGVTGVLLIFGVTGASISFAIVTPSFVISGAPKDLSKTTFLPFGPIVTRTVFANLSTPAPNAALASDPYLISFAMI